MKKITAWVNRDTMMIYYPLKWAIGCTHDNMDYSRFLLKILASETFLRFWNHSTTTWIFCASFSCECITSGCLPDLILCNSFLEILHRRVVGRFPQIFRSFPFSVAVGPGRPEYTPSMNSTECTADLLFYLQKIKPGCGGACLLYVIPTTSKQI